LPTTVTKPFALLVLPIGSEAIFLGHGVCCCSSRRPKVGRVEVVTAVTKVVSRERRSGGEKARPTLDGRD